MIELYGRKYMKPPFVNCISKIVTLYFLSFKSMMTLYAKSSSNIVFPIYKRRWNND